MNGGDVILADEPTGALDKNSGIEVMRILRELNAKGHTIILVTHDHNVAKNATRIIEISDGNIISDKPNVPEVDDGFEKENLVRNEQKKISSWRSAVDRLGEAPYGLIGHECTPDADLPDHARHHYRDRVGGFSRCPR